MVDPIAVTVPRYPLAGRSRLMTVLVTVYSSRSTRIGSAAVTVDGRQTVNRSGWKAARRRAVTAN